MLKTVEAFKRIISFFGEIATTTVKPLGRGCSGSVYALTDFEQVVGKPLSNFRGVAYDGDRNIEIDMPHGLVFKHCTSKKPIKIKRRFLRELHMNIILRYIFKDDMDLLYKTTALEPSGLAFIECGTERYLVYNELRPFCLDKMKDTEYLQNVTVFIDKVHKAGWAHTDMHKDNLMTHPITGQAAIVDFESLKSLLVYPLEKDVLYYGQSMTGI